MKPIFDYDDYRKYLADYYSAQKAKNKAFSFQYWANQTGFNNKSFLHNVIRGIKNLSRAGILQLSQIMKHSKNEAEYFEHLVCYNQAKKFHEREHYFEKLRGLRSGRVASPLRLTDDQFEFYSKWYHVAVRSLIDLFPFKGDYRALAKLVRPSITARQAEGSVALLKRLGLIEKGSQGVCRVTNKTLTTGPEVKSLAVQRFHLDMLTHAAAAIKTLPREKRHITGLTLGISEKAYQKACEEIIAFQERLLKLAEADSGSDRVIQVNFQAFPLSALPGDGSGRKKRSIP